MGTVHIEADKKNIAKKVLMPGDPNRVKYIAETYLEDYKLVNERRGELAYTGFYKNKEITVFSSGMGIPSMGIYSYELFDYYDVDAIIRIGTAGTYTSELNIGDLFLTTSSFSESNYSNELIDEKISTIPSSIKLNEIIKTTSKDLNIELQTGSTHTVEAFYKGKDIKLLKQISNSTVVEMETYALLINAKKFNKQATSILTITDNLLTKEKMEPNKREKELNKMIKLALESIIKL